MAKACLLAALIVLGLMIKAPAAQSQKIPSTQSGSSWTTVTKGC